MLLLTQVFLDLVVAVGYLHLVERLIEQVVLGIDLHLALREDRAADPQPPWLQASAVSPSARTPAARSGCLLLVAASTV